MKASPEEMKLHLAILNGEDIALSKLYDVYSEKIAKYFEFKFSTVSQKDNDFISIALNDAFLGYYSKPDTFNPERSSLYDFLKLATKRDLLNVMKKEEKHISGKNLIEDVELWKNNGNSVLKAYSSADATVLSDEIMTTIRKVLQNYFHTELDIELAIMILSDVRKTEEYSDEMQIGDLTASEQTAEVKKHKDRIKKVIERNDIKNKIKNLLK